MSNSWKNLDEEQRRQRVLKVNGTLESRFWKKVDKASGQGPHGECWGWTASLMVGTEYGCFHVEGKTCGAHRYSWKLNFGEIPDGLFVLHSCDYPPCVSPATSFLVMTQLTRLTNGRRAVDWSLAIKVKTMERRS